jgi:hypothetical protein
MPALVSEGDKRCSAVDSPSARSSDKLGGGVTRDTGYPKWGGEEIAVGQWDTNPLAIQGW